VIDGGKVTPSSGSGIEERRVPQVILGPPDHLPGARRQAVIGIEIAIKRRSAFIDREAFVRAQ